MSQVGKQIKDRTDRVLHAVDGLCALRASFLDELAERRHIGRVVLEQLLVAINLGAKALNVGKLHGREAHNRQYNEHIERERKEKTHNVGAERRQRRLERLLDP